MPWHIAPKGGRFCVVKDDTGEEVKCHPTKEAATAHMRALYANEPKARTGAEQYFADRRKDPAYEWQYQMALLTNSFAEVHPVKVETIVLGNSELTAAIARTPEEKANGMLDRSFTEFEAMVFVYDEDVQHAFHGHGMTELLGVCFYAADGTLQQAACLEPDTKLVPKDPYRYAVEFPWDKIKDRLTESGTPGWASLDGLRLA